MAEQATTELASTATGAMTGLSVPEAVVQPMTQSEFNERKALLAKVDKMDASKGTKVTSAYWEATSPGESIRGIFTGMTMMHKKENGETREIPAVVIDTSEGVRLCGGTILIDTMLTSVPAMSPVEVTYTGKKGNAKTFDVVILQ